jgi:hypothetical protein
MSRRRPICPECNEKITRENDEEGAIERCCSFGIEMHDCCSKDVDTENGYKSYYSECYDELDEMEDDGDILGDDGFHNLYE